MNFVVNRPSYADGTISCPLLTSFSGCSSDCFRYTRSNYKCAILLYLPVGASIICDEYGICGSGFSLLGRWWWHGL